MKCGKLDKLFVSTSAVRRCSIRAGRYMYCFSQKKKNCAEHQWCVTVSESNSNRTWFISFFGQFVNLLYPVSCYLCIGHLLCIRVELNIRWGWR